MLSFKEFILLIENYLTIFSGSLFILIENYLTIFSGSLLTLTLLIKWVKNRLFWREYRIRKLEAESSFWFQVKMDIEGKLLKVRCRKYNARKFNIGDEWKRLDKIETYTIDGFDYWTPMYLKYCAGGICKQNRKDIEKLRLGQKIVGCPSFEKKKINQIKKDIKAARNMKKNEEEKMDEQSTWRVVEMVLNIIGEPFSIDSIHKLGLVIVNEAIEIEKRSSSDRHSLYKLCIGNFFVEISESKEKGIHKIQMRSSDSSDKNYNIVKQTIENKCPSIRWEPGIVCKQNGVVYGKGEYSFVEFYDGQFMIYVNLYRDDIFDMTVQIITR